ncbi:M48 family metallopeptidase [Prosthecomicrobium pneumaticum]|uniref:YgjP-like metallopeptidase domain-containing protein n=1 Tax=Prosthecomicrobium pneumaticum TaxID=81895 RepID=A0A7W9FJS9_9HYPH|nr:SprT family zinc-dependent metalloprotease [Prosthecomicrobium pneumaticum]MBB5751810.1 hypothetical protein [Prosthecomicrobium pneumaticum]
MRLFAPLSRAAAPKPDHLLVAIDGEAVRVAINWNARARRYTLRLRGAVREPVVTIPARGRLAEAQAFLDRHAGWLKTRMAALPAARPIADGATLPFRGAEVTIVHRPGRGVTRLEGDRLIVAGDAAHLKRRVLDFLRREARADLVAASERHAAALGVAIRSVTVKDPVSRWGSCSSSGALSYSFRLVMAPPFVLDYLAAHEVAHLKEMNHSARFWRLVDSLTPQVEPARAWLARNGAALHAVGA